MTCWAYGIYRLFETSFQNLIYTFVGYLSPRQGTLPAYTGRFFETRWSPEAVILSAAKDDTSHLAGSFPKKPTRVSTLSGGQVTRFITSGTFPNFYRAITVPKLENEQGEPAINAR